MLVQTKLYFTMAISGLVALGGCHNLNDGGVDIKNSTNGPISTTKINPQTTTATCDFDVSDTSLTNHGWTKAFDDEFTGDLSNWYVLVGGLHGELQCNEAANAQIVNGVLQITAKRETVSGPKTVNNDTTASFDFTSAWLSTKQSFSANSTTPKVRLVARIKVATGYGVTSLFWTYGNGVWPTTGEIDCVEAQGNTTKMYSTDYAYGTTPGHSLVSGSLLYNPTSSDLASCYHVYVMEWTQNSLNSYLDGNLVEMKTTVGAGGHINNLFGTSQYVSLNVPVGGWFYDKHLNPADIQCGTMYVDYVKVFTSK
ncbi:glycoside hydrolase family 16 protein [Mucilaginibacter sp. BT774]|uniref:glycoside hydrolase family 16 protein n=1 Tax=Mucilaginibacter sp. BT774 TaxID=3062276 RepID=UPI00267472A1|nr:glycoside hydrolase family 16 protein [Mucilaginibacter sp. BT774]MDO3628709.1 glycoside hydrolase family 16 protein [Mucilaginibacter sp. BT774]